MQELLLLLHPTFGVLGIIAAVWVFVEVLNASPANHTRIKIAALLVALFMVLAWISGGYLYVFYYAADKALILKGPWPFAHTFFMEVKEHLFFITLVLALFLPVAAWSKNLAAHAPSRTVVLWAAALVVLSGLAIEGAGAAVALGVKMALAAGVTF